MERWIDISDWQGAYDAAQVKAAGVAGVVIKASEGTTGTQEHFLERAQASLAAGLQVGAYHFCRPDAGNNPVAEADHFLATVAPVRGALTFLALDLEVGTGNLSLWALAGLGRVQAGDQGRAPWLYSGLYFCASHLTDARLAAYPLWLAAYQGSWPWTPQPWTAATMWQYTSTGSVPGVPGAVDEDWLAGLPTFLTPGAGASAVPPPLEDCMALVFAGGQFHEAVVGKRSADGLYHAWYHCAPTEAALAATPFSDLGGNVKAVAIAGDAAGNLVLSARGGNDAPFYRQRAAGSSAWSGWVQGGGLIGTFGE